MGVLDRVELWSPENWAARRDSRRRAASAERSGRDRWPSPLRGALRRCRPSTCSSRVIRNPSAEVPDGIPTLSALSHPHFEGRPSLDLVGGLRMTREFNHIPVMVSEVVSALEPVPGGLLVDATVGGGGHAAALLSRPADPRAGRTRRRRGGRRRSLGAPGTLRGPGAPGESPFRRLESCAGHLGAWTAGRGRPV